jgi:hypothetical protein
VAPTRPIRSWWSRAGARCRPFDRPVSPARIPEPGVPVVPAPGSPRNPSETIALAFGSAVPAACGCTCETPVFTGGSCPADSPRLSRCAPSPCGRLSRPRRLLRALRHDPPPAADHAPALDRAATGRFPRSPSPGRPGRRPALPRQHRHAYAADFGVTSWPASRNRRRSRRPPGRRALQPGPHPSGWSRWKTYETSSAGSSRTPSGLACRTRTV